MGCPNSRELQAWIQICLTQFPLSMNERLLCELLPYLDQNITLSLNKIIYIKRGAHLIKRLAHGWENNSIWNNSKLFNMRLMTQGILRLGNFIIMHENQYWVFTLIPVLTFYLKPSSLLGPPSSTLCPQKCCSRLSFVAVRSISKVEKNEHNSPAIFLLSSLTV